MFICSAIEFISIVFSQETPALGPQYTAETFVKYVSLHRLRNLNLGICLISSFGAPVLETRRFAADQRFDRWARFHAAVNVNCEPDAFASGLELQQRVPNVYGTYGVP